MISKKQLKINIEQIEKALDNNDDQNAHPEFTANFTLGWIRGIISRSK